jgi:hypothetical protein
MLVVYTIKQIDILHIKSNTNVSEISRWWYDNKDNDDKGLNN